MINNTKRAIILKNLPSANISEAIIFLNDHTNTPHSQIVEEAQKIISDYIKDCRFNNDVSYVLENDVCIYNRKSIQKNKKRTHKRTRAVILSLITAVIALCMFGIFNYINS